MAKFDNAKVGYRVFSIQYGLGTIDRFGTVNNHEVFKVNFDNGDYEWYFKDGRVNIDDVNPTLFWNEFHVPTEEEDKKLFNLVEFLRDNLEPKEFEYKKENLYLYYSPYGKRWYSHITTYDDVLAVYFKKCSRELVDTLDDNEVTPQQLKDAYKTLGWL